MRDVIPDINKWIEAGKQIALATVVQTWGSAPRKVGAHMAISAQSEISGSVSGGCVEGAVVSASQEVLVTGKAQLLHFGVADETAWEVGLACGGEIEIFVQPLDIESYKKIEALIAKDQAVSYATTIKGSQDEVGKTEILPQSPQQKKPHQLAEGQNKIFINTILPAPSLLIVGGVQIAIALTKLAKVLNYSVTIIDPRRAFGSPERFPDADNVLQEWPKDALESLTINSSTAIATLTHDPKIDDPALIAALQSPAFYIGALGSSKTQAKRRARLIEAGLSEAQVDKIKGPIGLKIGAQSPEEIALSIVAEIVATRHERL